MEPPNEEIQLWIKLTTFLARPGVASTLYSRQYSMAEKRAKIWREAHKRGLTQDQIARAFNVSQQAVSKAIKGRARSLVAFSQPTANRCANPEWLPCYSAPLALAIWITFSGCSSLMSCAMRCE
jgi:predicted XRE-type DNA-binding protein